MAWHLYLLDVNLHLLLHECTSTGCNSTVGTSKCLDATKHSSQSLIGHVDCQHTSMVRDVYSTGLYKLPKLRKYKQLPTAAQHVHYFIEPRNIAHILRTLARHYCDQFDID